MTDKIRSTIYRGEQTDNRNRGIGGAPLAWAYRFFVENADGSFSPGIMTQAMAKECRDIAARNPEDVGEHAPDRFRTSDRVSDGRLVAAFLGCLLFSLVTGVAIGLLF